MAEEKDVSLTDYMNFITNAVITLRKRGSTKEEALQKISFTDDNEAIQMLDKEITERVYAMPIELL
jgi:hypothetical protein